ncbi:dynein regulatory complex protein 9-like [Eucyclogobius newberryi]|uniref:dynein regulatory complex protein 9-like n=1 Tax=Eucyclogobius newberryi TaxID=166745 RepID=UPI003B594764
MQLSRTQSLRVAAVLEDFQNQLVLLTISFTVDLDKNLRSPHEKVTLNKLIQNCHNLSELMVMFRVELEEKQTFNFLLRKIEDEEQRKQMIAEHIRRVTKADFREKQAFCSELEEELENKRALVEKLKDEYAIVEDQLEEQKENNQKIKHDKEDKLLMLQKEANDKEKTLEEQIMLVKEQMEKEQHAHKVSIQFLQNQQEEMKQQRDLWEERTRRLRQEKAQQLNDICCKITLNLDRLMEMRRKFRVMEQVVKEDVEEQEKRHQEQELIKAATKMQAFWRGCMVRKGLGIYKKTEEDKKVKKKDGGKEGKKKKKK